MIQVTANAAGIIRACEPVNQSTAVDYLTAPGNPGHSVVETDKSETTITLLIATVPILTPSVMPTLHCCYRYP